MNETRFEKAAGRSERVLLAREGGGPPIEGTAAWQGGRRAGERLGAVMDARGELHTGTWPSHTSIYTVAGYRVSKSVQYNDEAATVAALAKLEDISDDKLVHALFDDQGHVPAGAAQGPRHRRRSARLPLQLPGLSGRGDRPPAGGQAALAHAVRNPVDADYARSDLFERRRKLMAEWDPELDPAPRHPGPETRARTRQRPPRLARRGPRAGPSPTASSHAPAAIPSPTSAASRACPRSPRPPSPSSSRSGPAGASRGRRPTGATTWNAMRSPASARAPSPRSAAPTCWRSSRRSGT